MPPIPKHPQRLFQIIIIGKSTPISFSRIHARKINVVFTDGEETAVEEGFEVFAAAFGEVVGVVCWGGVGYG